MVRIMSWTSPQERRKFGQTRRKQIGRLQHSLLNVKMRPASALDLLDRSMRGRVAALVKLKYELMAETPFAYFRGAAPVMAADLAVVPNTGVLSQGERFPACADA